MQYVCTCVCVCTSVCKLQLLLITEQHTRTHLHYIPKGAQLWMKTPIAALPAAREHINHRSTAKQQWKREREIDKAIATTANCCCLTQTDRHTFTYAVTVIKACSQLNVIALLTGQVCLLSLLSLNPTTGIINEHWSKGNGRQRKWGPKETREKWSNGIKQQQKQLCSSCQTMLRLRRLLRAAASPAEVNATSAALCPPSAHTHKRSASADWGSCLATECSCSKGRVRER